MVSCYLPQFNKYLGICDLRTGIYIKSALNLIVVLTIIVINIKGVSNIVYWGKRIHDHDIPAISDLLDTDVNEEDLANLKTLYRSVLAFFIVWLILKISYLIVICCTIAVIYKQKPKMLKILLYINIPNWIFDFIISILAGFQHSIALDIFVHLISLSEAYNLLAMRSEYKRMTGKVTPVRETPPPYPNGFVTTQTPDPDNTYPDQIHCRTCTCNLTPILQNFPTPIQQDSVPEIEPPPEYKELNFKEQPIIFNQNQLVEQRSSVIDYTKESYPQASGSFVARPTTLALDGDGDEKKIDISDVPVIYDENQLNVGSSPIIEDRL